MVKIDYNLRAFKKKTFIKNPAHIEVTVDNSSHNYHGLYSKFTGSNRELAEAMTRGSLGKHTFPKRPFMLYIKKKMDTGYVRNELKDFINNYCLHTTENGIVVDWQLMARNCEIVARNLLIDNALGLTPISPVTEKFRKLGGLDNNTPLFASGQLVNAITADIVYDYNGR